MTDTTDHQPEPWFHEIGSDDCPHGAEPDDENTPEWEAWEEQTSARHTGSPQDVRICLDAPAGQACGVCSENDGEFVPWSSCRVRNRARREEKPAVEHRPLTVTGGSLECLERECEDFFTEDGDEIPGMEACSHLSEMEICEACSEPPVGALDEFPAVVAWTDCTHRKVKAGAPNRPVGQ
jgi:hypothetical protein